MPEMSTTVENEPPTVAPVITTRAKVVRESFTALRSDFEINSPPPVIRPQRPAAEPISRGGGQSNIALSIGGGILLVGGICAFLFFGYGSNSSKGNTAHVVATPTASKITKGAAEAAVTPVLAVHAAKTLAHDAHSTVSLPPHKTAAPPVAAHQPVAAQPPRRELAQSAAHTVAIDRPRDLREIRRTEHVAVREKPIAATLPRSAPHVEAPVHRATHENRASSAPVSHRHEDASTELDPLHSLGN